MKLPITIDPAIMSGKPVFSGTRVPVETIVLYLSDGNSLEEFLEDFPTVNKADALTILENTNHPSLSLHGEAA
jgi:uncharacterized protein (DUF433 family)